MKDPYVHAVFGTELMADMTGFPSLSSLSSSVMPFFLGAATCTCSLRPASETGGSSRPIREHQ